MPFRPIIPKQPAASTPIFVRARTRPFNAATSPSVLQPESSSSKPKRKHHVVDRTGPNWDKNGDYIHGKNRPPKSSQWKPGQSGNPRGPKPREKLDPEAEMDAAILAEFMTTVNGQQISTNLGLFALNVLKSRAAQKDRKAASDLLDLYYVKLRARGEREEADVLLPEEQAMLDALFDVAGVHPMPSIRNRLTPLNEPETDHE